ncbi:MAG: hypothetical protein HQ510_06550 [Candidatus Marinimicrobia bacterium]|nr:hypothetical protein [Candidatus Neomarinimicrobiota bacterium]
MKILIFVFSIVIGGFTQASDFEYVGSNKCKTCHKKEAKGAQYVKWNESRHGNAFATLMSEAAVEIANKMELKTAPHESPECVGCHTTGYAKGGFEIKDAAFYAPAEDDKAGEKVAKRMENLKNVGCENCHGPGSEYKSKKVMQAIYDGTEKGDGYGMLTVSKETCLQCHNEKSPTFDKEKPFNFEENMAKIAHKIPIEAPTK